MQILHRHSYIHYVWRWEHRYHAVNESCHASKSTKATNYKVLHATTHCLYDVCVCSLCVCQIEILRRHHGSHSAAHWEDMQKENAQLQQYKAQAAELAAQAQFMREEQERRKRSALLLLCVCALSHLSAAHQHP